MKKQNYCVNLMDVVLAYQHNENEEASSIILDVTENRRKDYIYKLYDVYGKKELEYKDLTKEAMENELCAITLEAVRDKFVVDPTLSESEFKKNFHAYVGRSMQGIKKYIEEDANGVSHHYASILMRIKKNGHDIWTSPDDVLCQDIVECKPQTVHPHSILEKVRFIFSEKTVYMEDVKSTLEEAQVIDDNLEMVDLMSTIKSVSRMCTQEEWEIFCAYYIEGKAIGEKITRDSLSEEYTLTIRNVDAALKKVSKYVRKALSSDLGAEVDAAAETRKHTKKARSKKQAVK